MGEVKKILWASTTSWRTIVIHRTKIARLSRCISVMTADLHLLQSASGESLGKNPQLTLAI